MVWLLAIDAITKPLYFLPLLFAILDWIGIIRGWKRSRYVTKPGVILSLLLLLWVSTHFDGKVVWFALALLFSLIGDYCLILPCEQFQISLASFFLAHISYIIAYTNIPLTPALPSLLVLLLLICIGAIFRYRVVAGLKRAGRSNMCLPILLYQLAISLMVLSATSTIWRLDWSFVPASLTSIGALSFFTSDLVLGWNRFVNPIMNARLKLTILYHVGQIALIVGVITNTSPVIG